MSAYPTPQPMARSFVVLGDSLSVWAFAPGETQPCKTCAWPTLLAAHDRDFVLIHNGAVAGNNTFQMISRFRRDVVAYPANMLIVLAGTNDVGQDYSVATIVANIHAIVRSAAGHGFQVVVLTIPPNNADRIMRLRRLRQTNAALINLGRTEGFQVIDIYSALVTDDGHLRRCYAAADGLHLSLAGEQKVAETVYAGLMAGPAPDASPSAPPWFGGDSGSGG
jgi:lysophospholipase L1-like esterase